MGGTTFTLSTAVAPPAVAPLGTIPRDLQYPRRPGIWACAGHPGGTDWRLRPNDSDGYQDSLPGLFLQHFGIQYCVLHGIYDDGWRGTGGGVTGHPGTTPGLEHKFDMLPLIERDELQGCHWRKIDPAHQLIDNPTMNYSFKRISITSDI